MSSLESIELAFSNCSRENFLPSGVKERAGVDAPLYIGYGQTNSQPTTVRMMLQWLDVEPKQNVLDVGAGSGWTTALLANLVGPDGKVTATEIVAELVEFGRDNCKRLDLNNVEFHKAGKKYGYLKNAPYDRILVSAAASEIPEELLEQLAPNGIMVIPIANSIDVITKYKDSKISRESHYGFAFVPLI